jgi:hypothetical protein
LHHPQSRRRWRAAGIWDWIIVAAIFFGIVALAYASLRTALFEHWFVLAREGKWITLLLRPTMLWVAMGTLLLVSHRIVAQIPASSPAAMSDAPMLTVVILPITRTHGRAIDRIRRACRISARAAAGCSSSMMAARTIPGITSSVRQRSAGWMTAVRFPENRGKKPHWLKKFRRASAEVVITVDSDSVVERNSLLAMVGPFRPKIGAVAGESPSTIVIGDYCRGCCTCALRCRLIFCAVRSRPTARSTVVPARWRRIAPRP